jgi:hypothetical protein
MEDIIKTVTQFGIVLVEKQHRFFLDDSIDNSEHVSAIKRIVDAAYEYLKAQGVTVDRAKKAKAKLINHGRDLFIQTWMTPEEDDDLPDEEDRLEAKETFDELLEGE